MPTVTIVRMIDNNMMPMRSKTMFPNEKKESSSFSSSSS